MARQENSHPDVPFDKCTMTPSGVVALVQHLRTQPLLGDVPVPRLRAMAIAYLAHGGTDDGKHYVGPGKLHDAHFQVHRGKLNWRDHMRDDFRQIVTDLLTWLDRLSGGGSLLVHASGTRPPDAPAVVEEVKLDVFLPFVLLREDPAVSVPLARIIQHFAEHIAFPIMERWGRAKGLHEGGRLQRKAGSGEVQPTHRWAAQGLIPTSATPYHIFYGRPPGSLETLIASLTGAPPPPIIPSAATPAVGPSPTPATTSAAASPVTPSAKRVTRLSTSSTTTPAVPSAATSAATRINAPAPTSTVSLPATAAAARVASNAKSATSQSTVPATEPVFTTPDTPRSTTSMYVSPSSRPNIKVEYCADDPWTAEDAAAWAEIMEPEMSQPGGPIVSPPRDFPRRLARDPATIIDSLETRVVELEGIVYGQADEIERLQRLLQETMTWARAWQRPDVFDRSNTPSSATFGHGRVSSVPSSLSYQPSYFSRAQTPLGFAAITQPGGSPSRLQQPTASSSAPRSPNPSQTRHVPIVLFGFHSDRCIEVHGLPLSTHHLLQTVERTSDSTEWANTILSLVPDCTEELAEELMMAMQKDCGLAPSTP
ncbi:hypothetical protein LXA43DRAFT_1105019 [Ganoderma leucocontextum]|nr:hypothetical protein LXA43DRAFT_1105019 [Ganoderma leucocontextum]